MKHLMTLAALFVSSLAMAQMPYNPDANGDNMVGSGDLLTFLTFYGSELIQSDLTCEYEGTELEQLIIGAITGVIQIDSVYTEYLLYDTIEYFTPGCPDLVLEPVVLERSYFCYPWYSQLNSGIGLDTYLLSYQRTFQLYYSENTNQFDILIRDHEIEQSTSFNDASGVSATLPFSQDWTLDGDGIQVDWQSNQWASHCEYLRVIPFWSVAE